MNKAWYCTALALALSGCTLPFPQSKTPETKVEIRVPSEIKQLNTWATLSDKVLHSNETQRQQALGQLANVPHAELKRALWLSHPKASLHQRQQAQQLFQQHLSKASASEQKLLSVHQAYNQELINNQRLLADRQQQINNLTQKLKELASIDQQINDRKFQE